MLLTFETLCPAVKGTALCNFSPLQGFESVVTDSRNVTPLALFVPLRGEKQDGHGYIEQALKKGAVCFFADNTFLNNTKNKTAVIELCRQYTAVCIQVENTLYALQTAAAAYLAQFPKLLRIGVTGSNGKTTTKELLGSIFSQQYKTIISEGNFNSETGLPLSVFRIRKEHEVGIFELGMNRKGEIAELAAVLKPQIAVITNIGTAHIGFLGSKDIIAAEKKQIFSAFNEQSVGFIPENDEYASFLKKVPKGTIYGYKPKKKLYYSNGLLGTIIYYKGETIRFPLPGIHNIYNAFAAIAVAEHCCIAVPAIKAGLENIKMLFGRSQVINGPVTYLLDCYNANPDSMQASLSFCRNINVSGRKIYLLASMKELGSETGKAHREVCRQAFSSDAEALFFFGSEMYEAAVVEGKNSGKPFFCFMENEAEKLSKTLDQLLKKNDFVFLKGSRSLRLEQFEPILQKERE